MDTTCGEKVAFGYRWAKDRLLDMRNADGYWIGRLASSAVSTATAVSALSVVQSTTKQRDDLGRLIDRGVAWLVRYQNRDGGWGDTDRSHSNIATSMLAVAALRLAKKETHYRQTVERAEQYIERAGSVAAVFRRYGRDRTFAVPILTNAALAGMVDWKQVPQLPFELACFPQSWYRFLPLPVVSYAIPALVAIGQVRHAMQPTAVWPWRWVRRLAIPPSLRVLERMQPASGGYLEATPLTSFVVMSLAAGGYAGHPVVQRGVDFLVHSVRDDGSWPIDTNLATWLTTLAINALTAGGEDVATLLGNRCLEWLLSCQTTERHPFTGAEAGGWGWSDLSGAVPDADDTPGALLALAAWWASRGTTARQREQIAQAVAYGARWLLNLQNRDGGWPTFCRGWGKLPFDRSGADLTAHALRALCACEPILRQADRPSVHIAPARLRDAVRRGFAYLERVQGADGSWQPLWFGNQDHPEETNPVYGTARVLLAYQAWQRHDSPSAQRGLNWLVGAQHADGSWSTGLQAHHDQPGSIEETSVALEALAGSAVSPPSVERGVEWLVKRLTDQPVLPAPIGLYFAKLWYYEELYPWVFATAALGRLCVRGQQRCGSQLAKIQQSRLADSLPAR